MDILDILIAKKKSFTGETEKLTRQANEAMAKANQVAAKIDDAEEALNAAQDAQEAAEAANTRAQEIASDLENMKEEVTSAANEVVNEKIAEATGQLQSAIDDAVTDVNIENDNTSSYKGKKAKIYKKGILNSFNIIKNYITTGSNEDGSMTQKAITNALNNQKTELENKIKNIKPSSGGSGNISGDISASDAGSIVNVDETGNITASSIKEADIILTQIVSGTYKNDNVVGLELDYVNKTFTRLQAAKNLNAGEDFNKFKLYGGRKRCVVDEEGNIQYFLTGEENSESLTNKRIMVYQPAFYYLRVPLSISKITNGFKIDKEHLYLADQKYAGFNLHPLFKDENGNALRYVLLPAFESCAYRVNSNTFELRDAQNIDLENDCLASVINAKPISGQSQNFTIETAKHMCENNGQGWKMTNLEFESVNQMLMMVEYGTPNIQNAFNAGVTKLTLVSGVNLGMLTGSTLSLGNNSGQASLSTNFYNNQSHNHTTIGECAISYRGMENPFGNMWRFIEGISITNNILTYKNTDINFKLASTSNWLNAFGYDEDFLWAFLPIETSSNANSNLPIGDYYYAGAEDDKLYGAIIGGNSISKSNAGLFYYAFNIEKNTFYYQHDTARVMFIPTPNTLIDNHNYNLWSEVEVV